MWDYSSSPTPPSLAPGDWVALALAVPVGDTACPVGRILRLDGLGIRLAVGHGQARWIPWSNVVGAATLPTTEQEAPDEQALAALQRFAQAHQPVRLPAG